MKVATFKDIVGKVVWDKNEETYHLEQKYMNVGLCEPLWQDYENKKVRIIIEVL